MKLGALNINVKRSKRKTISIYIERDGSVTARVPNHLDEAELTRDISSKEYLIHKHIAEWTTLNESKVIREYVNGQSFLYLGRNYRLRLIDEESKALILKNGRFLLSKSQKTNAKEFFKQFYKSKLLEKLGTILPGYERQMGQKAKAVKVMELQGRWASCTTEGNLSFHWKCAMAPIDVIHYIVVHELAHLIVPNHSPSFWNEVDKILPNYSEQKAWLQRHGAGMDL